MSLPIVLFPYDTSYKLSHLFRGDRAKGLSSVMTPKETTMLKDSV